MKLINTPGKRSGELSLFVASTNCGVSIFDAIRTILTTKHLINKRGNTMIKIVRINKHEPKLGVITIASEIQDDNTIIYGVSFHNPKDKYDKKFGIQVALNRLDDFKNASTTDGVQPLSYSGQFLKPKKVTFNEIIVRVCCDMLVKGNIPAFAETYIKECIFSRI